MFNLAKRATIPGNNFVLPFQDLSTLGELGNFDLSTQSTELDQGRKSCAGRTGNGLQR